ncbi:tRNA (adenosine(37)-N6)-threonylcarbamoyltransferase complex dimerization subunit type 1 TsaB [Paenibacillus yanchengensis]|uniref:tRNA (Adenosine(37)-N6)-threonylcarbamoyltransferase complex dimerization subunit type 1 TsaB n=1 Tax=Paenibacillus yanchengensis TaxID=2035833 RepID=A0ABW4YH93_9BACL
MNQSKEQYAIGAILALDTATSVIACAIVDDNTTLAEQQTIAHRSHSVYAVSHVQQLLETSSLQGTDLAAIVIGIGPGSYTGVRVAVSAGKTLAYAWKKPLVTVSTLAALAWGGWSVGQQNSLDDNSSSTKQSLHWVIPLMDARRGQVYTAAYEAKGTARIALDRAESGSYITRLEQSAWHAWQPDAVLLMEQWIEVLTERAEQVIGEDEVELHLWFVGELDVHLASLEQVQELLQRKGIVVHIQSFLLDGRYLAELGHWHMQQGEAVHEGMAIHTVAPNYAQLTEAEVNLQKKL